MAKKITLFSRFMKTFQIAKDGVIPAGAVTAVELETGRNFGWTAKKIDPTATPEPEPEPEPETP